MLEGVHQAVAQDGIDHHAVAQLVPAAGAVEGMRQQAPDAPALAFALGAV